MARQTKASNLAPVLSAAQRWIAECLISDGSLFSDEALWTAERVEEVRRAFVEHPDLGKDDFITKLRGQMSGASPGAQQLMAEMSWALLLFPSNINEDTKRNQINDIWSLSGHPLDDKFSLLTDPVLGGIGSGGPGFNNHRWREIVFLISIAADLKGKDESERRRLLSDYDAFTSWISTVPQQGRRQFRHMLRFFAFPDKVERMSSNKERWAVLKGFQIAPEKEMKKWSDRQFDEALLNLRKTLEAQDPSSILDFYEPPLRDRWRESADPTEGEPAVGNSEGPTAASNTASVSEEDSSYDVAAHPRNVIYYGPPGTGKTHLLQKQFAAYTESPEVFDHDAWVQSVVGKYGWRAVIAAALADIRRPARVPEIRSHAWVQAKARDRGRSPKVQQTIWSFLQAHTPDDVTTVRSTGRRPPAIFTKSDEGTWALVSDWRQLDDESDSLLAELTQKQQKGERLIRRYRVVTFHPSFTYEDFVRGIRPVADSEDNATQFRIVDGVFKQICDQARENPSKRYALFIDEINRANIAKVFGELITLIEINKRAVFSASGELVSGLAVQLPGTVDDDVAEPLFGVPTNLDIYGTMNTADRSIALLDVALRRRFEFKSVEPDYSLANFQVQGIHVGRLLERINERLEYLLDRDHLIGHAYLMSVGSLNDLRGKFSAQIIPLLQEYFFEDMGRVASVLATVHGAPPILQHVRIQHRSLFSGPRPNGVAAERDRYLVTHEHTWTPETFTGIYATSEATDGDSEPQ